MTGNFKAMSDKIKKIQNYILRKFSYISRIPTDEKVVYLTFDDGPEPGIAEFVLDELAKYGFKATFFCRGDNAEMHPELLQRLINERHAVASHTYSHMHAYEVSAKTYLEDVEKAEKVLHTSLFRPPHGSLTFRTWMGLRKKYKIAFWSINSEDSDNEKFNYAHAIKSLKTKTKPGDVVLFHFCHKHEKETRLILPVYLDWLADNGFKSKKII